MVKNQTTCWLLSIALMPAAARADQIKLLIQEYAPYTFTSLKSNEIEGILTDKVREMMRRAGDSGSIVSTSTARALFLAKEEENSCAFGYNRSPERDPYYKWIGPLIADNWVLYGKKSNPISLTALEDARRFTIGTFKNSSTGALLGKLGYKVQLASQDEDNPRLLLNGRIDFWATSEMHGEYIARQQGYASEIAVALKYRTGELFMLCHPQMDAQKIELYNKLNKELDADGTTEKILRKYSGK